MVTRAIAVRLVDVEHILQTEAGMASPTISLEAYDHGHGELMGGTAHSLAAPINVRLPSSVLASQNATLIQYTGAANPFVRGEEVSDIITLRTRAQGATNAVVRSG